MPTTPMYVDLFAGCGGLSAGLYLAGWQGLFAVERNADAFHTLQGNLIEKRDHFAWPNWLPIQPWSIEQILAERGRQLRSLRESVDLVVGGPPCQGFSTAGRRQESDTRNNLVHSYLEFVESVRPLAIMFENVKGFTMKFRANGDGDLAYSSVVIEGLKDLGYYDALGEVIDASQYGVPQKRQRYIAIATTAGVAEEVFAMFRESSSEFLRSRGIPLRCGARTAISDLESIHGVTDSPDSHGFESGLRGPATTGLQKYLRIGQKQRIPDSHRFVNHTNDVVKVFKKLLQGAPRNSCICGDSRTAYGLKKRSVTVLASNRPSPTVTTIPDDFVHYLEPRVMTARECARLQTFPDWYCFKGPYTTGGKRRVNQAPRYSQIGNAVPPLLAEQFGVALRKVLYG